jgi:predicted aspartyl protease
VVVVVAVIVMAMVVMGSSRMRVIAMPVVVMLDLIATRVARMRPEDRDQAGQNGAQQRQKDDCLNHQSIPLRMIS